MCCGRLRKLTREKFRESPPPHANPPAKVKKNMGRVDPPNPPEKCAECGSPLRKLTSCCNTTYRCTQYPKCRYIEKYDKQGVRR